MVRRYGYDLEWTDAQTGGCHLHKTESHGTRCLTDVSAQIRDYFRDAACTEPLIKVGPGSCEGTRPTGLAVKRRDPADACSHALVYEARKIEGEYTGQVYAPSDGASCSERSRRAGESFFELSDKLPLDSFPAVNRVQE